MLLLKWFKITCNPHLIHVLVPILSVHEKSIKWLILIKLSFQFPTFPFAVPFSTPTTLISFKVFIPFNKYSILDVISIRFRGRYFCENPIGWVSKHLIHVTDRHTTFSAELFCWKTSLRWLIATEHQIKRSIKDYEDPGQTNKATLEQTTMAYEEK